MPAGEYRAVFFDVGGTLSYAEPSGDAIWLAALEEHGFHVARESLFGATGVSGPDFNRPDIIRALQSATEEMTKPFPPTQEEERAYFRRFDAMVLERLGILPQEAIMDSVDRRFREDIVVHAYEDAEPALQAVKAAGYRIGVISNATHDIPERLRELGLSPYFDAVAYSFEVGVEKPHPAIFTKALERLGVEGSQAVHVGDDYRADVLGARGVGMTPMLIAREGTPPSTEAIVLRSLVEVMEHL